MNYGIGIDLGGTRIKSARFDLDTGKLLATRIVDTDDGKQIGGEPAFVVRIRELVIQHEAEMAAHAKVVGLSAPGLAAKDGSCIISMPEKLLGLENRIWSKELGRPVKVTNDAHAALLGEIWQGAAKDMKNVVMLTLGTGVGGAVVCDGRLLKGHLGRAGHIGHTSVDLDGPKDLAECPGSIEYFIGNGYLQRRTQGRFTMTRDLLSAVAAQDPFAIEIWQRSLKALAVTLASMINLFDPEVVLIGGGIANDWQALWPTLQKHLNDFEWRVNGQAVPVLHASLGEWAGCYGAVVDS
jgi:glucokinase